MPLGGFLLGQAEFVHQGLVAQGLFHAVQVLALQVLYQGQLLGLPVVGLDDHCGDLAEPRHPAGPPAPLSGDNLVVALAGFPDGKGLDNPVDADGVRQCGQLLFVKVLSGLLRVGLHPVQGQHFQCAVLRGGLGEVSQKGPQAPA